MRRNEIFQKVKVCRTSLFASILGDTKVGIRIEECLGHSVQQALGCPLEVLLINSERGSTTQGFLMLVQMRFLTGQNVLHFLMASSLQKELAEFLQKDEVVNAVRKSKGRTQMSAVGDQQLLQSFDQARHVSHA
jgi:hypothetical protein